MEDQFLKMSDASHDTMFSALEVAVMASLEDKATFQEIAATLAGNLTAMCDHIGIMIYMSGQLMEDGNTDGLLTRCVASIKGAANTTRGLVSANEVVEQIIANARNSAKGDTP